MIKRALFPIFILFLFSVLMVSCDKKSTEAKDQCATPSFSPGGGLYHAVQSVTITCATDDALIRYTINGTEPSNSSPVYSAPISITTTTTLKARAYKEGWTESPIISAAYTIAIYPDQMVLVPGGTFNNGTSNITVSSIYLYKHEITQTEFQSIMGSNPSYFASVNNGPVEMVTWYDAIEYCNRRSINEDLIPCYRYSVYGVEPDNWPPGWNTTNVTDISCDWNANGYRLPTEAEWQFAARGGNQTHNYTYSGSNTIDDVAWYWDISGGTTHAVETKNANELGVFDMSGNVWEWVWDIYGDHPTGNQTNPHGPASGIDHQFVGGSWGDPPNNCTVSSRQNFGATAPFYATGFRVCRIAFEK